MTTRGAGEQAAEDPDWNAAVLVGTLLGLVSSAVPLIVLNAIVTSGAGLSPGPSRNERITDVSLVAGGVLGAAGLLVAASRLRLRHQRATRWWLVLVAPALPWLGMVATFYAHD